MFLNVRPWILPGSSYLSRYAYYHLTPFAISCFIACRVADLWFILSVDLDPRPHIEHICCKTFNPGVVLRSCREFRLGLSFKVLYSALVRPIDKYDAVIWDNYDINDSLRLKRVQCKLIRYASFRLNISCEFHNNEPVTSQLGLVSLTERKRILVIKLLNSLIQGNINSPDLLSLICSRVP